MASDRYSSRALPKNDLGPMRKGHRRPAAAQMADHSVVIAAASGRTRSCGASVEVPR